MIKAEKIQINPNISNKTFLILIIFSICLFLIFGVDTIKNIVKINSYEKITAVITEVGHKVITGSSSADSSNVNYIKFNYNYNGNKYKNEQRVVFKFNKKMGDSISIYINPDNPNEIMDTYMKNVSFIATIVSFVITIFLIKAYRIKKSINSNEDNQNF